MVRHLLFLNFLFVLLYSTSFSMPREDFSRSGNYTELLEVLLFLPKEPASLVPIQKSLSVIQCYLFLAYFLLLSFLDFRLQKTFSVISYKSLQKFLCPILQHSRAYLKHALNLSLKSIRNNKKEQRKSLLLQLMN